MSTPVKSPATPGLKETLSNVLYQKEGVLTRELLLKPGGFGLGMVPEKQSPDSTTTSVCGFCSTGCTLTLHLKNGEAVGLTPNTEYPVNLGMACPKGWEALKVIESADRATMPLLRNGAGQLVEIDWPEAIAVFCERFKKILNEHGREAAAWIGTGQMPTEELAMLGSLGKFGMGLIHGDGNTRQCMATAVVAYKESFGFDAPPYTYQDFEESDTIFLIGSNLCIAHPILWERVMRNPHSPQVIVIDPRKTETACAATWHVPLRPKSDLALFYSIAAVLIRENWIDRDYIDAYTEGFAEFAEFVAPFTPELVAPQAGLKVDDIVNLACKINEGERVSFWWTMGVNQGHQAVRTAQAIIALALMTKNIGRPGTGANSITGQCNAMGSRLFSNTTNLLGGHDFLNATHRKKVADTLGIPVDRIPDKGSLAYPEIITGAREGRIKGLWVIATNPAHSWIDQNDFVSTVREKLDFLVTQDMYRTTETAQLSDLVLPAAGWGEKDGTFINSERRIGTLKKVRRAPGKALSDFLIFKLIAQGWGCADLFKNWNSTEDVFQSMKALSKGQPCDISGIPNYYALDEQGGVQWPCPEGAHPPQQQRRLFEDGKYFTKNQRAKFCFEQPVPHPEETDYEFRYTLLTGRGTSAQWHTQTRTAKSPTLRKLYPQKAYVEVNPTDAHNLSLQDGDWVCVESRRGSMNAMAFLTHAVQPGQLFLPMHYPEVNRLTQPVFDTYSRQPSYKACAVKIWKVSAPGKGKQRDFIPAI